MRAPVFQKAAEQPRSWFNVGDSLLASARLIWETSIAPAYPPGEFTDSTSRVAFLHIRAFYLLAGFSAENYIKGVHVVRMRVVGKKPFAATKGKLALKYLNSTHKLVMPARQADLAITADQESLLRRLEDAIQSAGRYPFPVGPRDSIGIDRLDALDWQVLESVARLCHQAWRSITAKRLPGGRRIWKDVCMANSKFAEHSSPVFRSW
jgi:hypothetical protein